MKLSSTEKQRPYRAGLETKQSDESAAKSCQKCELRPIEKISDRPKWSIVDQKLTQVQLQVQRRLATITEIKRSDRSLGEGVFEV